MVTEQNEGGGGAIAPLAPPLDPPLQTYNISASECIVGGPLIQGGVNPS